MVVVSSGRFELLTFDAKDEEGHEFAAVALDYLNVCFALAAHAFAMAVLQFEAQKVEAWYSY